MRSSKLRAFLIALMLLVFAAGLAFLLYPSLWGAAVDPKISLNAQGFLNRDATEPTIPEVIVTIDSLTEQEETRDYPELWADMVRYNETIYTQGQAGLSCEYDYQKPSFRLSDYGLGDEVFGVISIRTTSTTPSRRICPSLVICMTVCVSRRKRKLSSLPLRWKSMSPVL